MATAPTRPLVPVEEYLKSAWHPDVEYVDGVLVERGMPTYAHGVLAGIITEHLRRYRREFAFGVSVECRVEIVECSRYRIPDVLISRIPVQLSDRALRDVPLAVFEVLSPDDRTAQQLARFREFWQRGVRQILVFNPEDLTCLLYTPGSLVEKNVEHIELPDGRTVPFSSAGILQEFAEEVRWTKDEAAGPIP
jgi:Uma2 family endonuclease